MLYHLNDQSFEEGVLRSELPVLVDFYADWCGPCRMVAPIVEELAKDYDGRIRFVKINVDECAAVSQAYSIMSIPTLLFFRGGKVVDQVIGALPKPQLEAHLQQLL